MDQQIRFCTTQDGVRIAYCVHGEGPPLVFVRGWTSHLHVFWDDPYYRAYFEALARAFTVVRFDMRGNGLSDRDIPPVDLATMVADVEAVTDTLSLDRMVLYGQCFGGPAAVAYATAHPERVSHLILDGTYADGRRIAKPEQRERLLATLRDLPEAGRLLMSHYTYPAMGATWPRLLTQRSEAMDRDMALQLYALCYRLDVTELLPQIAAPTLVMHRRQSRAIPFRLGRELASCIAGARFVELHGAAHNPWHEGPEDALAAVSSFLGVPLRFTLGRSISDAPSAAARTILVSEAALVDSTSLPTRELRGQHDSVARSVVRDLGGEEMTHAGDGVIATFAAASRALDCAASIQRALRSRDAELRARIGINAGEPHRDGAVLTGAVVQLAHHICEAAAPGSILLTNVVRELCAGKPYTFEERGLLETPDPDEPTRLFELRPQP
jgi:pimeloyl-ACP methyl ester carboxylesterase